MASASSGAAHRPAPSPATVRRVSPSPHRARIGFPAARVLEELARRVGGRPGPRVVDQEQGVGAALEGQGGAALHGPLQPHDPQLGQRRQGFPLGRRQLAHQDQLQALAPGGLGIDEPAQGPPQGLDGASGMAVGEAARVHQPQAAGVPGALRAGLPGGRFGVGGIEAVGDDPHLGGRPRVAAAEVVGRGRRRRDHGVGLGDDPLLEAALQLAPARALQQGRLQRVVDPGVAEVGDPRQPRLRLEHPPQQVGRGRRAGRADQVGPVAPQPAQRREGGPRDPGDLAVGDQQPAPGPGREAGQGPPGAGAGGGRTPPAGGGVEQPAVEGQRLPGPDHAVPGRPEGAGAHHPGAVAELGQVAAELRRALHARRPHGRVVIGDEEDGTGGRVRGRRGGLGRSRHLRETRPDGGGWRAGKLGRRGPRLKPPGPPAAGSRSADHGLYWQSRMGAAPAVADPDP